MTDETARPWKIQPVLEFSGVTHDFDVSGPVLRRVLSGAPRRVLRAVDGVSFRLESGTTLALVGESGCGKTTVARLSVGLYKPRAGSIHFEGKPLAKARAVGAARRMNMIFQDPYASLNPRWRVRDIIAEPIRTFRMENNASSVRRRVEIALTRVGLAPEDGEKYPHEFSGGQRQRVSIARALASEPVFLACDEPTSALDVSVQAQILNLMRDLQRRLGLSYLFISHNIAAVRHMADRLGVMYLGRVVEIGDADTIFHRPRHPYTRQLLDAIPTLDHIGRASVPIAGEAPSPMTPPPGCPFHPRCPLANARCRVEIPVLRSIEQTIPEDVMTACHAVAEGRD